MNKKLVKECQKEFKITAQKLKEFEIMGAHGLNNRQIYEYYGLRRCRWFELKHEHPEIDDAIFRGKAKQLLKTAGKLNELIDEKNFNAIKLYLENNNWGLAGAHEDAVLAPEQKTEFGSDPVEASRIYQKLMSGNNGNI